MTRAYADRYIHQTKAEATAVYLKVWDPNAFIFKIESFTRLYT